MRALALYESLELSSLLMISILPFKLIQDKARPQDRRGQPAYKVGSSDVVAALSDDLILYGNTRSVPRLLRSRFGEPGEVRTRDPMIKSHVLCQLSYRLKLKWISANTYPII